MSAFTTTDGCRLDYRIDGPADATTTVVALHGWSQSRAMWDRCAPALSRDLRLVTLDQRGHGESDKPSYGARIPRLALDLHELLDHEGLDDVVLMGHSLGCSITWSYLDLFGEGRVRALVLIDQPSACTVLPWMTEEEGAQAGAILDVAGAEGFCRALLGPDATQVRHDFLVSMLREEISTQDLAWLEEQNFLAHPDFLSRLLLDHVMQDWRDLIPRITLPTLVIGGEASHVDPDSQRWIAEHIPSAELTVFTREQGGSHFSFFEGPEAFVAEVGRFLRERAGARA